MAIIFRVVDSERPLEQVLNVVQLIPSVWDDYSFKTSFGVVFHDSQARRHDLGIVKIGYINQQTGLTRNNIPIEFPTLPDGWFSLGQDVDYYRRVRNELSPENCSNLLSSLKDVVANDSLLLLAQNERVFNHSLMRVVSMSVIHGQFRRVLAGHALLTDFWFIYQCQGNGSNSDLSIDFRVRPESKPSTNIHVLIGRNGVGKTTLLNRMVNAILGQENSDGIQGSFSVAIGSGFFAPMPTNYFSSVVSVSFSAFDKFIPPADQPDRSRGIAYFYVGMKSSRSNIEGPELVPPKTDAQLGEDFVASLLSCLSQPAKRSRWLKAIERLESDNNFAAMSLARLASAAVVSVEAEAHSLISRMSSGHCIVLLTITKLVDTVEEKTLVLLDEPESHLHPPLLSAFTRALSDLLHDRNGVAVIATHSPVVVQEVPQSCVWKLTRLGNQARVDRPERETFGENVGVLTREIFGLEVSKSGFHDLLQQSVNAGGTFGTILEEYGDQLGIEAQAILRVLISARDNEMAGE